MADDSAHSPPSKRRRLLKEPPTIQLTENEQKIFSFLLDMVKARNLGTVMRAAGGWVRDKLLGEHSDDIDIALDNMMGVPFAEHVNEYLVERGFEPHHVGVIRSNPEQSKHLETATIRIFGVLVDFVNLRVEKYSENSRIPTEMAIGTPTEDAIRRDLTVNSLFYNINEARVEDFTNMGLDDLRRGIIRTPLPPITTFLDDPLRILRAFRFAARLHFELDSALSEAAREFTVQQALDKKIARERIAKELEGMLKASHPSLAFHYIVAHGLYDIVFRLSSNGRVAGELAARQPDFRELSVEYMRTAHACLKASVFGNAMGHCHAGIGTEDRRRALLGAFFLPLAGQTFRNAKGREEPLTNYVVRESIKFKVKDVEEIALLHQAAPKLREHVHALTTRGFDRRAVGLTLREAGPLWEQALLLALVSELGPYPTRFSFAVAIEDGCAPGALPPGAEGPVEVYRRFVHAVVDEHRLVGVWSLKPLLNGAEAASELKVAKGPILGEIVQWQIEWQLEHPEGTRDQLLDHLKARLAVYKPKQEGRRK